MSTKVVIFVELQRFRCCFIENVSLEVTIMAPSALVGLLTLDFSTLVML